MSKCTKTSSGWLLPSLAVMVVAWPLTGHAQASDIDPDALALLRKSTDYLAATKQFSVVTDTTIEVVPADGQKLQFGQRVAVNVQRPNKMRAERIGELISQTFYYDGQSLIVNLPEHKYFAKAAVPATLDGMLDTARDKLSVIAPGADFVYANAYERLTDGLTSAFVVGKAVVERYALRSHCLPQCRGRTGRSGSRKAPCLCRANSSSRRRRCPSHRSSPR